MPHQPRPYRPNDPGPWDSPGLVLAVLATLAFGLSWYVAYGRFHLSHRQIIEIGVYSSLAFVAITLAILLPATARSRRETQWPHPPMIISPVRIEREMEKASDLESVALGYDIHGEPWLWPDHIRVM